MSPFLIMISTLWLYHARGYKSGCGRRNRSLCRLTNMTITNDLVETFLKCPTKCFLRSRGEAETGNAYAAWVQTKNDVFRIEGTKRLVAGVAPDKCAIGIQAMEALGRLNGTWVSSSLYRARTCNVSVMQLNKLPRPAEVELRSLFRFDSCSGTSSTGTASFCWRLMREYCRTDLPSRKFR